MEEETNYGKKKTFDVLKKIRKLIKITPEGDLIRYQITDFFSRKNGGLSPAKEDEILCDLEKWGALKIEKDRLENEVVYYIKILPKFEDTYQEHERIFTKLGENKKDNPVPVLYLNEDGDLWREPKEKHCYKLVENSNRHRIVHYLTTHRGYQQTNEISAMLENKSEQSIRTEILKIRGRITKFLKIDGKEVLEARKGSGYRIGKKYKIQIKKV